MKSTPMWQSVFFLAIFFCAGYWFVLSQHKPSGVHEAASRRVQNITEYNQMNQQNLQAIIRDNNVSEIDQLIPLLPKKFLSNFTIKHGLMNLGPRGHLAEGDVDGLGLHSEPLAPRAFVFDTATGFVISYNGGKKHDGSPQEGGQTLDTMSFDPNSKTFQLSKIDFPLRVPGQAQLNSNTCTLCHGDNNRPIFSMYPDWPRFYGSDNDELKLGEDNPSAINGVRDVITRRRFEVQAQERSHFHNFRNSVVPQHPRYAPLFDPAAYGVHRFPVSNSQYPEYPYRSDVEQLGESLDASAVSRSFTRRAGLRFNLLYSRLLVQQVVEKIKKHPRFPTYGKFFVYNIMRCGIEAQPNRGTQIMQTWGTPLRQILTEVQNSRRIEHKVWNEYATSDSERLAHDSYFTLPNGQLTVLDGKLLRYDQNLALFDLKLSDVDMRFTYYHPAYLPKNAFPKGSDGKDKKLCEDSDPDCSAHVMSVGYLQKWYFNSYNDGGVIESNGRIGPRTCADFTAARGLCHPGSVEQVLRFDVCRPHGLRPRVLHPDGCAIEVVQSALPDGRRFPPQSEFVLQSAPPGRVLVELPRLFQRGLWTSRKTSGVGALARHRSVTPLVSVSLSVSFRPAFDGI